MSTSATSITYERIEFKENPKRYLAFDDKDVLDYIVKVKTAKKSGYRIYTMYHSNGDQWLADVRGQQIMTMVHTGNGFKFTFPNKKFNLSNLNYNEAMYIRLLTTLEASISGNDELPRVIEDTGDVMACD